MVETGCAVCRSAVLAGSPPEIIATSVKAHAHLRKCPNCGSWWEEGERESHVISETEARQTFSTYFEGR